MDTMNDKVYTTMHGHIQACSSSKFFMMCDGLLAMMTGTNYASESDHRGGASVYR